MIQEGSIHRVLRTHIFVFWGIHDMYYSKNKSIPGYIETRLDKESISTGPVCDEPFLFCYDKKDETRTYTSDHLFPLHGSSTSFLLLSKT